MTANEKKSAPGGTQIPEQDYGTTPGDFNQWIVEFMLEKIGDSGHPMTRHKNATIDRDFRGRITEMNTAGEDVIVNNGKGYFRAGPDDGPAVREYVSEELHRAHEIEKKARTMLKTWEELYGNL